MQQTNYISTSNYKQILEDLKNVESNQIKAQFCFKSSYQRDKFMNIYDQDKEWTVVNRPDANQSFHHHSNINLQDYSIKEVAGIQKNESFVFLKAYRKQLKEIERDYSYIFFIKKGSLQVYIKEDKLSQIISNHLIQLKNQIKIYPSKFYHQKINSSPYLQQLLKNQKIQFVAKTHQKTLFYSSDLDLKQIRNKVQQILKDHISFLKLYDLKISKDQREIFKLIIETIKPDLKEIEEYYETMFEYIIEKCWILNHNKYQIFAQEPNNQLIRLLKSYRCLSFQTKTIRRFSNELKHSNLKQLHHQYANGKLYLLIETKDVKQADIFLKIFQLLLPYIDDNLILQIYLNHFTVSDGKFILELAEKNKLQIINYMEFIQLSQKTLKVSVKNYQQHNASKKKNQVLNFLTQIITLQSHIKEMPEINFESKIQAKPKAKTFIDNQNQAQNQKRQEIEDVKKCISLSYEHPIFSDIQTAYKIHKICQKVEEQLRSITKQSFKVKTLQINKNLKIAAEDICQEEAHLVRQVYKQCNNKTNSIQTEFISNFKPSSEGFIVYLSKDREFYVASYWFRNITQKDSQ